ncbi:MAG: hypothetical protein R2710_29085 [Acidimicrobiales bacterium]
MTIRNSREIRWPSRPLVTVKASLKEGRSDQPVFSGHLRRSAAVDDRGPRQLQRHGLVGRRRRPGAPASSSRSIADSLDRRPGRGGEAVAYRIEFAEPTLASSRRRSSHRGGKCERTRFNRATGTVAAPLRVGASGRASNCSRYCRTEPAPLDHVGQAPPADEGHARSLPPQLRGESGRGSVRRHRSGPVQSGGACPDRFTQQGFYDHGDDIRQPQPCPTRREFLADPRPGRRVHRAMHAAAGLLAAVGEVPARVVVGYRIPADRYVDGTAVVVADDIAAWIEIRTVEFDWVPIVTPDAPGNRGTSHWA